MNQAKSTGRFQGLATAAIGLLLASRALAAGPGDGFEQHAAHEHGNVTLNVAVDGEKLLIELLSPAANIVGFEHRPATATERSKILTTEAWLRSGVGIAGVPAAARCQRERVDFQGPDWAQEHHDAKPHQEQSDHSDYRVQFHYRCANTAALTWLEPWLLQRLIALEQTTMNVLSGDLQTSRTIGNDDKRVPLR